jgi:hypothetical protein
MKAKQLKKLQLKKLIRKERQLKQAFKANLIY